ncbi:hypothetical protein H0H92_012013 [Tricholoma furcatifolium]|nr:hypothetical protein H0H92_012013 [Tricholoma furcatifolium]
MEKPVIYVFSPLEIKVSISIILDNDMEFTAVYPIVPIQKLRPHGQKVQWHVQTSSNGTLVERETGLELSSLVWEANLNPRSMISNAEGSDTRIPWTWTMADWNSVVLPIDEVTGYLENVLHSLGLHKEARRAFITFLLPSFSSHMYICLRFMPQADFSRIAPLDIIPKPDVVTRIFMLFKGVRDPEAWPLAQKRALDDVSQWNDVVGTDPAAAFNNDLSRVVEWGAMELPP